MCKSKVLLSAPPAKTEPIAQLLDRAVNEMRDLTSVVNELEALIGNLVIAGSFGTSHSIYDLQKLDHVRQSIGGIADFLEGIGRDSAAEWMIDTICATADVKLSELGERLRGQFAVVTVSNENDGGHFELFGDDDVSKVA